MNSQRHSLELTLGLSSPTNFALFCLRSTHPMLPNSALARRKAFPCWRKQKTCHWLRGWLVIHLESLPWRVLKSSYYTFNPLRSPHSKPRLSQLKAGLPGRGDLIGRMNDPTFLRNVLGPCMAAGKIKSKPIISNKIYIDRFSVQVPDLSLRSLCVV